MFWVYFDFDELMGSRVEVVFFFKQMGLNEDLTLKIEPLLLKGRKTKKELNF